MNENANSEVATGTIVTPHPETFEQFCERMGHVEKKQELQIGSAYRGNWRTIFEFEGQHCHLETFNMPVGNYWKDRNIPPLARCLRAVFEPPTSCWIHTRLFYTKKRAAMLAKHYKAKFYEDEYPLEAGVWFYLHFSGKDDFERLMRLVWDIRTGAFKAQFGDEAKQYQSCIGYDPREALRVG
jgi:hypothetical protein